MYLFEYGFYQCNYHIDKIPPAFLQVMCMLSILATGAALARQAALRCFGDFSSLCLILCGSLLNGNEHMHLWIYWQDRGMPRFKDSVYCVANRYQCHYLHANWTFLQLELSWAKMVKKRTAKQHQTTQHFKICHYQVFFCHFIWWII